MFCRIALEEFVFCSGIYFMFYVLSELFEHTAKQQKPPSFQIKNQEDLKKTMITTMETLDEHKDTMPQGTYVEMCNNVRDIWDCVT